MATEVQQAETPSATALVGGIITDLERLVKQQLRLTRREVEEDLHRGAEAATVYALGAGIGFLGGVALCSALAYLLHQLASPPGSDAAWFPLWACHAVIGVALVCSGGCLAYVGRQKFQAISPLQSQAAKGLKENIEWTTAPK